MPRLLAAALAYALRGWAVLPLHTPGRSPSSGQIVCDCGKVDCQAIGKHPWTRHGYKDASTDTRKIRRWWRQWPWANIGLATGAGSGLLVLDIDPRHGGEVHLLALLAKWHGTVPATRVVNTGGGGSHFYYAHPRDGCYPGTTNLDGFTGIDVHADGNYVVAPPSLHASGMRYAWDIATDQIAPAPHWLLDLTRERPKIISPPTSQFARLGTGERWLRMAVERAVAGTRNETGFWLACQLRDDQMDMQAAQAILLRYQEDVTALDNPYTQQEALKSLRSAYNQPPRAPARGGGVRDSKPNDTAPSSQRELAVVPHTQTSSLVLVGNYREDQAVRRSIQLKQWNTSAGRLMSGPFDRLTVYFEDPDEPMTLSEAYAKVAQVSDTTVLTMRIAMGLWNLKRYHGDISSNGSVGITPEEILAWRDARHRDKQDRDRVIEELRLARLFRLEGTRMIVRNRKPLFVSVQDHYLRVSEVELTDLTGARHTIGVLVSPGDWIVPYEQAHNLYLAPVDRRIFRLNPHNEQHELRIALYLVERWRMRAAMGTYGEPFTMNELLRESCITVDKKHLTDRFIPRITAALQHLADLRIIGPYECLTPAKQKWRGNDWLSSLWRIIPPSGTMDALNHAVRRDRLVAA